MLLQITSDYFVAGVKVGEDAAPIIKYMSQWSFDKIVEYCYKKGWKVKLVAPSS